MPMFNGERLAELRKDKGWKQKELAAMLGIKEKTVSAYENNITYPSGSVQEKIARIFDISLDYLNGLTDEEVSYDRSYYIALPKGYPDKMKNEFKEYMELLKIKYGLKGK